MQFLAKLFESISAQMLPTACVTCQKFQAQAICNSCIADLDNNSLKRYECCFQCSIPLKTGELEDRSCACCKKHRPYFDQTYCLDRYDGILHDALHQLKYQKRVAIAHGLAKAWDQNQSHYLSSCHADYLIPVPLSTEKLMLRGFNQSWEIARRIRLGHSTHKLMNALKRLHHSKHQAGHSLRERQNTIRGMFYIDDKYIDQLSGKTVIMFDDVMTSGATLNEIARTLKDAGVKKVINWVLLRTIKLN